MEQSKNNIVSMSYNDMFSHINNLSFSKKVSFIFIDSKFNSDLMKLKIPNIISNFFVLSNNKVDLHIPHLYCYKKINKKILKLTYNTSIIVSIKINDSDDDNSIKNIIKSLISLIKIQKNNIIIYNINSVNTKYYNYILNSIIALQFNSKREQYEYIYDTICDELDETFSQNNYCDFKNDKCIANREKVSTKDIMGCCYSFKYTALGNITDRHLCKYLNNKKCSTKCLTCKLYTCKYLKDKGYDEEYCDIFLKQKIIYY